MTVTSTSHSAAELISTVLLFPYQMHGKNTKLFFLPDRTCKSHSCFNCTNNARAIRVLIAQIMQEPFVF